MSTHLGLQMVDFRGGFFAEDPPLIERGLSAYWVAPGRIEIAETAVDLSILEHSQTRGTGLIDALFHPLIDLVCPSNQLSGTNGFPAGGLRDFGPTARPGHEAVGLLFAATADAAEKLRQRGVEGPCLGVVNINTGCGQCLPCRVGGSPDVCHQGQTYIGLGDGNSGRKESSWLFRETGRYELPGFLTEHAVPIPSKQFLPIPEPKPGSLEELAIYGLADAVACTRNLVDGMAIATDFPRYYRSDQPTLLVIGGGRLGTLCCMVLRDLVPTARIDVLDVARNRIDVLRAVCPEVSTHLLENPAEIVGVLQTLAAQGDAGGRYHSIINCASHSALDAHALNRLAENCLHRRGRIGRMDHTPVVGLEAGSEALVSHQLGHVNALGPADNFPYALDLLRRRKDDLLGKMHIISGRFADNVESIRTVTETSGARQKDEGTQLALGIQLNAWEPPC